VVTVVGVVAEGSHDYFALREFILTDLPANYARPIVFKYLQPAIDATSAQNGTGGWPSVIAWCQSHSGSNIETYFTPVSASDPACDLILIQLDGDALEPAFAATAIQVPLQPISPSDRAQALEQQIVAWLSPTSQRLAQLRFAMPVMQTEAWVLAAIQPNAQAWESLADCKTPFRALCPNGLKMKNHYEQSAVAAAANSAAVPTQSVSFSRFKSNL
jgi:hypothetical protein